MQQDNMQVWRNWQTRMVQVFTPFLTSSRYAEISRKDWHSQQKSGVRLARKIQVFILRVKNTGFWVQLRRCYLSVSKKGKPICRYGGIGRHDRFRFYCSQGHAGSSPVTCTIDLVSYYSLQGLFFFHNKGLDFIRRISKLI